METESVLKRLKNFKYIAVLEGIAVGFLAGIAVSFFRLFIEKAEALRDMFISRDISLLIPLPFICAGIIICLCIRLEKDACGSGIPQVKAELAGQLKACWWKVIITKIIGGVTATGIGFSVGREGPSVQIGAMAGKGFSRLTGRLRSEERLLITAGSGAGLAAAFNAPLAGVVFSLEEIHKNLSVEVLLASMSAAICSDFVSAYIFGFSPVFSVNPEYILPLKYYWLILVLGIILGICGALYNIGIRYTQKVYSLLKFTWLKVLVPIVSTAILCYTYPYVLGGGSSLVDSLSENSLTISALLVLLAVKYVFSMISFGSGTPGGIFLPLLVLGSLVGALFAKMSGFDIYFDNFIILGMAGYFSAIVKSPVTGIILISEMTGSLSHLLSLTLICLVSYTVSDIMKSQPVYEQLLDSLLGSTSKRKSAHNKIMLESCVQFGSAMDGSRLENLGVPKGCLVIAVNRRGEEIVPGGATVLMADDNLLLLCDEDKVYETQLLLARLCRSIKKQ